LCLHYFYEVSSFVFLRAIIGLFITIWLSHASAQANPRTIQLPDSVENQLKALEHADSQFSYLRKQIVLVKKSNAKAANDLARKCLALAKNTGNKDHIAQALYFVGSTYTEMGAYQKSEHYLEANLAFVKENGQEGDQARIYNELGVVYDYQGRWKDAIEVYFKSLQAYEKLRDSVGMAHAYNNIGLIHFDMKQNIEADSMFQLTLKMGNQLNDPNILAMGYSNLGMVYADMGKYAKALTAYKKVLAIDLAEEIPSQAYLGSDYNSIASCYVGLKLYSKAETYYKKALFHKTKSGNKRAIASTRNKFGILKIKQGAIAAALSHLNIAEEFTKEVGDPDLLIEIYDSKAKANQVAGRLNAAIEYLEKKEVLKDSLYKAEVYAASKRIEEEYESDKNEATIDNLTGSLQKKDSLLGFLVFGSIILLLFGVFVLTLYRLLRQKNKELYFKQKQLDEALDALGDQKKQVERQNIRLESALKIKTRFLSVISHEIRTPLHVIQGIAEIIRSGELSDEQSKQVGVLMSSATQLSQLVNEILDLNKLEAGKFSLKEDMFDFKQTVEELFESQRYRATSNQLQTELQFDEALPQYLFSDKVKLQQILNNLISNAIKFTNTGSVSLKIKLLDDEHNSTTIRFEVADTGIGISPEELKRIFEPFHQADYSMTRNRDGSGLGLAITKGLIELFGGDLKVESYLGQGSKFFFTLHLKKGHKRVTTEKPQLESHLEWPKERRILVAEDHEQNVLILKMILKRVGIEATITKNGLEALNTFKEDYYDVVLMDLHMPVMNGMESSKKMRQIANTQNRQPIIIGLTASNEEEVASLPMGLFDQVLYKPYRPQQLYQALEESLLAFV